MKRFVMPLLPFSQIEDRSMEKRTELRKIVLRSRLFFGFLAVFMALIVFATTKFHLEHLSLETLGGPFASSKDMELDRFEFSGSLPRGIVESNSDLELKSLREDSRLKGTSENYTALLAIPVGIKQKQNVDVIVRKFLSDNCSVILFHYDGNVDGWNDLEWSNKAIHILALNQTKWWFAKRFLHPDIVSIYDYIFLWDEDLGVENFHPRRYLQIMASEGLEISQPALDPDQSEIHHRITIRHRMRKVHRRVYIGGSLNCSDESKGPPCAGWVEGMAPVFSSAAWRCVWHLIQNDLIHGWGLDMKLGYCAQGDRTKKVGVIDSEFIVHQGIQSLGGASANKLSSQGSPERLAAKVPSDRSIDLRSHIRRQSTAELAIFRKRWDRAVREDKNWIDPFEHSKRERQP
ncbi:hypothetical protein CKAN_01945400 [Cinnamomum micranthum f. kanehirae]|uniref:DUF707 domain-containing protein n=1 Tax=Cinnamomum micranthum f. kanehirae TaxID=337451 RepID=A0A443PHZ1_9MAGN|nr:hypothetical protein CKAN_01945400 [Cinnamomum micranthum f. kanehirae]